jgi:four helix bundle protein
LTPLFGVADFKKLQVWQKAHALSLCVHRVTTRMRGSQHASTRSQLFRSAASIPANIAEGRSHKSENEFARFLGYAVHSATELEYHLILARDTDRIAESDFVSLVSQTITVRKMLYGLLKRLAASDPPPDEEPPTGVRPSQQ